MSTINSSSPTCPSCCLSEWSTFKSL